MPGSLGACRLPTSLIDGRDLVRADGQVCLDRFARRVGPILTRAVLYIVQDSEAADEIVQELYLALVEGRYALPTEPVHAVSWSLRMVRHRALDRLRRHKVRRRAQTYLGNTGRCNPATLPAPDEGIRGLPIHDRVREAVKGLRREERAVIRRRFDLGETQQEVGHALGIPLGTVKTRERLALARLRVHLGVAERRRRASAGPAAETHDVTLHHRRFLRNTLASKVNP